MKKRSFKQMVSLALSAAMVMTFLQVPVAGAQTDVDVEENVAEECIFGSEEEDKVSNENISESNTPVEDDSEEMVNATSDSAEGAGWSWNATTKTLTITSKDAYADKNWIVYHEAEDEEDQPDYIYPWMVYSGEMENLIVSEGVESFRNYDNEFGDVDYDDFVYDQLVSVSLPDSLEYITAYNFTALEEISFPAGVSWGDCENDMEEKNDPGWVVTWSSLKRITVRGNDETGGKISETNY